MAARIPDLTPELVARVERIVPEDGGDRGFALLTEDDYAAAADRFLAQAGDEFWVFAYGSLIWNPEFTHVEARPALIHGWRRSFCIGLTSWRATPDQPGLMLALDRGGSCRGMAFRLAPADPRAQMIALLKREAVHNEGLATFRWLTARTAEGPVTALAFYAMPDGHPYREHLPIQAQAQRLARAAGRMGSGAAYLRNTVEHLEQLGIHDCYLWDLQRRVAAEIAAMPPLAPQE
ncbi:gamma-glutamylcyclotransferase [Neotabrizicola shimadae]|uniref:glutathione-specific gamma-glutamylcyclotransferase n=1 Tax=Neotabrizicola shimadae TaxID=2807096 RepID=A0A8G0ZVD8_9RHOB|nr:gamma-glutamylcyclotransferase [Neotabrizicola shimadae]QYZ68724.1 gamma-glutamylcyclotransferase [Neotabrizicola shimadae]